MKVKSCYCYCSDISNPFLGCTSSSSSLYWAEALPCSGLSWLEGGSEGRSAHLQIPAQPARGQGCPGAQGDPTHPATQGDRGPGPCLPSRGGWMVDASIQALWEQSGLPASLPRMAPAGHRRPSWSPLPTPSLPGATAWTKWTQEMLKAGHWPLEGRGRDWGCGAGDPPTGVPSYGWRGEPEG